MKRFINFRPFVLIFLTFVFSIFSVVKVFLCDFVPIIVLGLIFIITTILFIISFCKKDFGYRVAKVFGVKSFKIICAIFLISTILSGSLSAISFVINSKHNLSGTYNISANIKEIFKYDGTTKLLLKDVNIDGNLYNFKISMSIDGETDIFSVGDNVNFDSYIYGAKLVQNGSINTSILKTGIQYYCSASIDGITKSSGNSFFIDRLKDHEKTILTDNMSEQNAGFCYAVLCGDKTLLTDEYYAVFKNSGLAHLLAVSGLHISLLAFIVAYVLKILHTNKNITFWIIFSVLLLFNIICEFSPSVFRASIMSLCLLVGNNIGERNDALSSVGLAGTIILTIQPLYLFDLGFLLSFSAVFGIFLLAKPFVYVLSKIKIPSIFSKLIAVTLSASVGTLPFVCKYFGTISSIAILSNLIVVPVFSVMFVVLLIAMLISVCVYIPSILVVAEFFINVVVNMSLLFSKFAMITTPSFDYVATLLFYFILFFASPYFLMEVKSKLICCFAILNAFIPILANENLPKYYNYDSVSIYGEVANCSFYTLKDNTKILINVPSDQYDLNDIEYLLKENKVKQIDYLLIFNYNDNLQNNVCKVAKKYNINKVVLFGEYANSTLYGLAGNIYSTNILSVCNDSFYLINSDRIDILYINNIAKAFKFEVNSCTNLHILYAITDNQINSNADFLNDNINILLVKNFNSRYLYISAQKYLCQNNASAFANTEVVGSNELWTTNLCCGTI